MKLCYKALDLYIFLFLENSVTITANVCIWRKRFYCYSFQNLKYYEPQGENISSSFPINRGKAQFSIKENHYVFKKELWLTNAFFQNSSS